MKTGKSSEVILVFNDDYLSHIEGKVLTIIEAAGLPQNQEKSIKDLIRQAVWDDAHNGWAATKSRDEWSEFTTETMTINR